MYEDENRACLPLLGSRAPQFTATTTFGCISLCDFKGKWIVLFSHPSDFTPVCTTEFIAFSTYYPYFEEKNVQLLGLSIDSNYSHLAWAYNIFQNTGIEIPFPIIDDLDMKISKLYGMIAPASGESSTVRSVFIIDDKQILRTILYYPISIGRNIPEILRIIDALQMGDREQVSTPANWVPGMPVIVPPPSTYRELKERVQNQKGYSCMDWYLCMKSSEEKDYKK